LVLAANAAAISNCIAQNIGDVDPPRWTNEDRTPQARYLNSKKEAAAAYQEALSACKMVTGTARTSCEKLARDDYRADLEEAKKRLSE
jgi:hypothetical protein